MKVKVKFANDPKEGKQFGNIKTSDDKVYMFKPGPVKFEVGKEYDIIVKKAKWGENEVSIISSADGKTFETDAKKTGGVFGGKASGDPKLDFAGRICAAAITKGSVTDKASLKKWFDMAMLLAGTVK